jgi:hypothetical protein
MWLFANDLNALTVAKAVATAVPVVTAGERRDAFVATRATMATSFVVATLATGATQRLCSPLDR